MNRFKQWVFGIICTPLPWRVMLFFLKAYPYWPRPKPEASDLSHFYTDPALAGWNPDGLGTLTADDVATLILGDLPRRLASVLDVGCGRGSISIAIALARPDASVTGVDIVPALVQEARNNAARLGAFPPQITFGEQSAEALSFPDVSFQLVLGVDVLCHLRDKSRALAEIVRVLQPGGKLILFDWVATIKTPPNLAALAHCPGLWHLRHYADALGPYLQLALTDDSERFRQNLRDWIRRATVKPTGSRRSQKLALVFMHYVLWCLETGRLTHYRIIGEKLRPGVGRA